MIKKIVIRKPIIEKNISKFFGEAIRYSAVIDYVNENNKVKKSKICFYDFSSEYEQYIEKEYSEAFVIGLLSSAMEYGYDIEFEAPISKRLYYQLANYYIPLISYFNKKYPMHNISLKGPLSDKNRQSNGGVATGCSGGVDSFYTITKYRKKDSAGEMLTHLVCSSSGTLDHNVDRIDRSFKKIYEYVEKIGIASGLPVIGCYNNLYEFYKYPYKAFNTFFTTTFCSVAFALNKLISTYYVNSGMPADTFSLDITLVSGHDCSVFDLFTVSNLCTDSLAFYSSGFEAISRNEKVKYIADDPVAQKYLAVCGAEMDGAEIPHDVLNCSKCKKCVRTMLSLYAIKKLDNFSSTFDIDDFKKNLGKRVGAALAYDHEEFNSPSLKMARENRVVIPFSAYLYKIFVFIPLEMCRKIFRRFRLVKKIGYALKLDYFMGGYRRGKNEENT